MCSEQINILAENALLENDEYSYIFEDWGFFMPFKFLTSDNVRYYLECNTDVLKDISDNNKKAKICFWDKKDQEYYLNIIKQSNMKVDNIITLYSRDKQEVFYIIECS